MEEISSLSSSTNLFGALAQYVSVGRRGRWKSCGDVREKEKKRRRRDNALVICWQSSDNFQQERVGGICVSHGCEVLE